MDQLLPTARDLLTDDYLVIRPSVGLLDAVAGLEQHPEDTAFVVDEDDRFLGLLTETACVQRLAARAYDEAIAETVRDVMVENPMAVAPDTDAYALAQAFVSCGCGVLPVIEDGRVVGAVSQLNLLRGLLAIVRHRAGELGKAERTAEDLKDRPEAIEQMQRVFAKLDRGQLATLLRRTE